MITATVVGQKDNISYNPMLKGSVGNVYSSYKSIINLLSANMTDAVEASSYENGKMYYSYMVPSYMGKLIRNLSDAAKNENKFNNYSG